MSYIKHEYKSGDKLYASDLNEMDEQIALNETNIGQLQNTIVDYRAEVNDYKEEVDGLPNNETLIDNVVEKVPLVKTAEAPKFVKSEDEMTDSSKTYVYDGYIYQYGEKTETIVIPGETVTVPAKAVIIKGYRYSHSVGSFQASDNTASLVFPIEVTRNTTAADYAPLKLTNAKRHGTYTGLYTSDDNISFPNNVTTVTAVGDGYNFKCHGTPIGKWFAIVFLQYSGAETYDDFSVTYDGVTIDNIEVYSDPSYTSLASFESSTTTEDKTETIVTKGFANTGCAFAPADYEARIIALEKQIGTVNEDVALHNSVGATFPPLQNPASDDYDGYDIVLNDTLSDDIYSYIDEIVSEKENVTKEILGKDESDTYDIVRYIFAKREYIAWQKANYPKMYAWKNGSTVIYSTSVSPRIGDTMYSTKYVGTAYNTVTAVNATNRSRTVSSLEFVRYESGDIDPTVIYTDKDDERNSNASITKDSITYNRYPLGDLGANRTKLIPIFVYANEHGDMASTTVEHHETKMCALVVSRFLRDLASGKQANNPFYEYIRDNCMFITIPVVNPFGFNIRTTGGTSLNSDNGYMNANRCNINRNYDTPGWDYMHENVVVNDAWYGNYAGSQNETQYVMNTMVESGAVVAMSLHGHQGNVNLVAVQGQNPDGTYYNEEGLSSISKFLNTNYGYRLVDYDVYIGGTHDEVGANNMPDVTCKSPSYITQCGAYGGIVEFSAFEADASSKVITFTSTVIENAYAQMLNIIAMWLSDYLNS